MASLGSFQEGPKCGRFEFRFPREGENLRAQESSGTCSATWCLPPTFISVTPPHSDRQNLCWSSGSQSLPLLLNLEDRSLNRRQTSLLLKLQQPLLSASRHLQSPCFRARVQFLGTSCCSRANQCGLISLGCHRIDPLKVLSFWEKHK